MQLSEIFRGAYFSLVINCRDLRLEEHIEGKLSLDPSHLYFLFPSISDLFLSSFHVSLLLKSPYILLTVLLV